MSIFQITREGATAEQKAELIQGVTDLLQRVLNKNPATTFVIIDEVDTNWGIAGPAVTRLLATASLKTPHRPVDTSTG